MVARLAELDDIEAPTPTMGGAEVLAADEEHSSHVYLYVPDLTERSGYSTHRVPERQAKRHERRVGFHR